MTGTRVAGKTAFFAVTENGLSLAAKLEKIGGGQVFRPVEIKGGRLFTEVKRAFGNFDALVFICASGIAVRAIAPLLRGKHLDPAVIVTDELGGFVISLLSGHLGGANRLAREIASVTGGVPVITTATDVMGLPCVEDIAGRFFLSIEDVKKIKVVNSAILKGGRILVVDEDPGRLTEIKKAFGAFKGFSFKKKMPESIKGIKAVVLITPLTGRKNRAAARTMELRPKEFVAGVGCRRGVRAGEVKEALDRALKLAGVSILSIRNLATIDIKKDERGLISFAEKAGLPIEFFGPAELNKIKRPPSGSSRVVREKTGAVGVSEPAALLSSGAKRIWLKKIVSKRVTVALARAPFTS
jgi:cobalt-precorrin 5A hydrolase